MDFGKIIKIPLGIQAKHHKPEWPTGKDAVLELKHGLGEENIKYGWVVTAGTFSTEAMEVAQEINEEGSYSIELIDGEQLATLLIESGVRSVKI